MVAFVAIRDARAVVDALADPQTLYVSELIEIAQRLPLATADGRSLGDCCTEGRRRWGMLKLMRRVRRVCPVLPPPSAFTGFRFPREVIVLAVRW
jgi:hypothetical protein